MELKKRPGRFEAQELVLVKSIVSKLISKAPFLEKEREDIEQILILKLWKKRKVYLPMPGASLNTYLYKVLKNEAIDILRTRTTDKRIIEKYIVPLEEKLNEGDRRTFDDLISEKIASYTSENLLENIILKEQIMIARNKLSIFQQNIFKLREEGFTIRRIAKHLRKPWSTVKDEMKRIQNIFCDEGLGKYVK